MNSLAKEEDAEKDAKEEDGEPVAESVDDFAKAMDR
jgi:hypothetical protein